ncbi:hypothetical protein [Streptomyces lutosisoli]|uniref:Uncharacterized protein n=1 Tax=Streptomyces lutosisoli TaxID=2665721 RepID=A0ABW2VT76_9ACTN
MGPQPSLRGLGLLACGDWPLRPGQKSYFEYTAAELFIREQFRHWFRGQYGTYGSAITWQLDFLFTSYEAEKFSPTVGTILKYMRSDFANPPSLDKMARFRRNRETGKLTDRLLNDVINFIGGFRKPDMCGITDSVDPARIELVEVSTEGQRAETRKELQEKMDQLRNQVVRPAMAEILTAALHGSYSAGVSNIVVAASAFRPTIRICPLPVPFTTNADGSQTPLRYDWICYEPTFADPTGLGEDGLVLYHIHSISVEELRKRNVPPDLLNDAERAIRRFTLNRQAPQLLPELQPVWAKYEPLFSEDTMRIFAYGATGIVAILALASLYGVAALASTALVGGAATAGGAAAEGATLAPQFAGFVAALGTIGQVTSGAEEAAQAFSGFAQDSLARRRSRPR